VLDLAPPLAALLPHSPGPYVALMLAGFAIGIAGHLTRARWLIVSGVLLIFLGAFLFPLAANLTTQNRPPPIEESRGDSGE
jgi:4-amino-4-deoxy-L-arabinose transferase-like glycosyltransferase